MTTPGGTPRVSRLVPILALLVATAVPRVPAAEEPGAPGASETEVELPSMSGLADEGAFRIFVNEEPIASHRFTWREDGSYRSDSLEISVDPRGRWTAMKVVTPDATIMVTRDGATAKLAAGEKSMTVALKPGTSLFENSNPALMVLAVRAYDATRGGKQAFPLFIVPLRVMDASLERLDVVERTIAGRDIRLTRYRYGLPGLDVTIWADEAGKVVLGDIPAQHAAYVREGYEALRSAAGDDPLLSKPQFEVTTEKNVRVKMRDGVELATDIYRPAVEGRLPVILVRTPYQKEAEAFWARFYARRGYVFAVQDCRGRYASQGEWEPFVNEPRDGYDTVEWLAAQPWSSGKVGMIGGSYKGWVQWWAARERPPHLTTMIPNVSPPDPFLNGPYDHGVFMMGFSREPIIGIDALPGISQEEEARLRRQLPVIDLDKSVLGRKSRHWRTWIRHPTNDSYWERANFLDRLETLDIPVFHQSGWYDGNGIGTKLNYLRMASYGHRSQKLVIGPWAHTDTAERRMGDKDFGEAAIVDLQREYLRWFDRWLKGVENGIEKEPLVAVFTMGSNRWLKGDRYPLPETRMTKYYLSSGGHANTSNGDGRLTTELPPEGAPPDRYTYDPGDPTPHPHPGYIRYYLAPEDLSAGEKDAPRKSLSVEEEVARRHAFWAKVDAERRDILVYDTPALEKPLTFVGPVSAVLYASTSAEDTDWFMRLSEVDSKGEVHPPVEGKIRARFRKSFSNPELLTPGAVEEYRLDLWQTGITIPVGGKLRAEVASAAFPICSRNLNTGGHNETGTKWLKAAQTILHDEQHPSHVLLPVIP